ncbi:MAG: lactonase family protein, partial [Treponema sp.]|nr:lactonase family protein [Treponema sp.]
MRNFFKLGIIAMVAVIGLSTTACDQANELAQAQRTVSFIRNHTVTDNTPVASFTHTNGNQFPASVATPDSRSGFTFTGYWTARSGGTQYFDANGSRMSAVGGSQTLQNDLRLYAQWSQDVGNGPGPGQIPANLVGTWLNAGGDTLTVNANGTFEWTEPGWPPLNGTFSVPGNNFTLVLPGGGTFYGTFYLSGNTLTMIGDEDGQWVFTREGQAPGTGNITWTVAAYGSPATTALYFTFSADPGTLTGWDILISDGTGSATAENLWDVTGTSRRLYVSNVSAGTVYVSIDWDGVASGPQSVTLVAAAAPTPVITWSVTASGSPTTNALNFAFSADPGTLTASNITISGGTGSATVGALSGSGTTRTLAVSNVSAGTINVSINRDGVASGSQSVTLVAPAAPPPV